MATLTWPTAIRPAKLRWQLRPNTASSISPFNGTIETQERPGARWTATITLDHWLRDEIAAFEAFMVRLRGAAGRFYLWNHAREEIQGNAAGTITVNGAGQAGSSLNVAGIAPGLVDAFKAGDYIGINGELKMVVQDADADPAGIASLSIEPPLRKSPPDAMALVLSRPTAVFMLPDDEQIAFAYERQQMAITLTAVEHF